MMFVCELKDFVMVCFIKSDSVAVTMMMKMRIKMAAVALNLSLFRGYEENVCLH